MNLSVKNFERITADPAQMGGVPCMRQIRIPVATALRLLDGGLSEGEIVSEYPDLHPRTFANACASPQHPLWSGNCLFRTPGEIADRQCDATAPGGVAGIGGA